MRLHVEEWGDPGLPPVLCLHGITAAGTRFGRLAQQGLAERFHVLAPDLRGHGYSDWDPPWDLPTHVGDLLETADRLGVERAPWIGHSFGGRLVMELVAHAPERVERAVLLDPAIWVPPGVAFERAELLRADEAYATVEEAVEARLALGVDFTDDRDLVAEDLDLHLARHGDGLLRGRYSRSAVIAAYGEMAKPPPPFEQLRVPTLIVRGERSDVTPHVLIDLYREGTGDLLEVEEVPGGHIVMWDALDETAAAIERFLGQSS